jgi:hypothetical protein
MALSTLEKDELDVLSFKQNLQEIAKIEDEHNFLGVRFSLREGARDLVILAEDLASHVLDVLQETVKLSSDVDSIPFVERYENP